MVNDPRHIYIGTVNDKPVEGIAFLYRGNLDAKNIFRWGIRLRFEQATRIELLPCPYQGFVKAKSYRIAEEFMRDQLGLQPIDEMGKPGAW